MLSYPLLVHLKRNVLSLYLEPNMYKPFEQTDPVVGQTTHPLIPRVLARVSGITRWFVLFGDVTLSVATLDVLMHSCMNDNSLLPAQNFLIH